MSQTATVTRKEAVRARGQAKSYAGKEHKWAVLPSTRANGPIISLVPTVLMWAITIGFNQSSTGLAFYEWLNKHYTPFQINAWWTFVITSAVYWAGGLVFMAFDLVDSLHERVKPYKVQPEKRVLWSDYKKVLWIVERNQLFVALPMSIAMAIWRPLPTDRPLPGALTSIGTFVFCLLCEEVGFYAVHRAVHSRWLYATIHKKHHEFKAPVAFSSTYCTMTEHLFSNLAPIVLGVLYLRSHWSLMVSFFCQLELGTLSTHSDYNLPFLHNSLQHDWHHYYYNENYGPIGIIDQIFGTNKTFKAWLAELKSREAGDWHAKGRVELAEAI